MNARKTRIGLRDGLAHPNTAQSNSGASTASRESSTSRDTPFATTAPPLSVRPPSQHNSHTPHAPSPLTFGPHQPSDDQVDLAQLRHFTASQGNSYAAHDASQSRNLFYNVDPQDRHSQSEEPPEGDTTMINNDSALDQSVRTTHPAPDPDHKGKRPLSTAATNEKELKELIHLNGHRTLESIARDVRNAERTQKSEKAKQLFAMRWLQQFCRHDKESVPRNRVYTYYAQRCGTDRVDILNAASFGKLVRVIFPGIQTRRLGVRGESKYHYVNLALTEDPSAIHNRPSSAHNSIAGDRATPFDVEHEYHSQTGLPADTATFPSQEPAIDVLQPVPQVTNPPSKSRIYAKLSPEEPDALPQMFTQTLKFTSLQQTTASDDALHLPSIYPYLPPKTDTDLADALTALYRTHCTSLIDAVRFVKEKSFVRLVGSFNGTMTVPVSKLFDQPSLAIWIKSCDWLMYQQIVRFVSQLALQVMPPQVFTMLRNVGNDLDSHIRRNFKHHPEHVLQAKLEPATMFSGLMARLLRVNETAHAAANLLMNDEVRNLMWQDWVKNVRPRRVIESELSTQGHEETYNVLTSDMRHLLEPLVSADWFEAGTEYQTQDPNDFAPAWVGPGPPSAEGIIERWATFLCFVPTKYPDAATRKLLHCVQAIGNACLRDITVNQAQSFGAWWITKVWVDEMMLWIAEMGGFLSFEPPTIEPPTYTERYEGFLDRGRNEASGGMDFSTTAGLGIDYKTMPSFVPDVNAFRPPSGPPTATFKFQRDDAVMGRKRSSLAFDFNHDTHDDSGIGMSLMDDPSHMQLGQYHNESLAAHR